MLPRVAASQVGSSSEVDKTAERPSQAAIASSVCSEAPVQKKPHHISTPRSQGVR